MRNLHLQTLATATLLATAPLTAALAQKAALATKAASAKAATTTSAPLAAMFTSYWEDQAKLFPLGATAQGDNRYNDQLPNDQTRAFRRQQQRFYQQYLASLLKFDRATLAGEDQVSYDVFRYQLEMALEGLRQPRWMMPFGQAGGLPQSMAQLGSGTGSQPFKTAKDYDNWLGRVHGFTVWTDSAIANFRQGIKAGVVLPKALVIKMIPQLDALVVADATKSMFYGPITKLPDAMPPADKARLTTAYQQAIRAELVPAYQKLSAFLKNEYLPVARSTSGFGALPGGPAAYRYAVKSATTTTKTPDEIYQTGLSEVSRLRTEMERVKKEVGFEGDLPAFFAYIKTSPGFGPTKRRRRCLMGLKPFTSVCCPT